MHAFHEANHIHDLNTTILNALSFDHTTLIDRPRTGRLALLDHRITVMMKSCHGFVVCGEAVYSLRSGFAASRVSSVASR